MNRSSRSASIALVLAFVLLAGVAAAENVPGMAEKASAAAEANAADFGDYAEDEGPTIADPLKYWNVVWFQFNDKLYFWLLKPVSIGYKYLLPRPLRVGIKNVFINLAFPVRFVNNMFQGKLKRTGMELSRFLVNSTVGVLGLWDPATDWFHWKRYDEDFDQTLGVWHLGKGFYLTWPLLGPSSVRGTFGAAADAALNPATYLPGGGVLVRINDRSLGNKDYETLVENAVDPYSAVRNAYIQNRDKVVKE